MEEAARRSGTPRAQLHRERRQLWDLRAAELETLFRWEGGGEGGVGWVGVKSETKARPTTAPDGVTHDGRRRRVCVWVGWDGV